VANHSYVKKYGDHPYENLENFGYNPDMKKIKKFNNMQLL
jgi:hypothetical protein